MSDQPTTHSWQVEMKSGANTRVDNVTAMESLSDTDTVQMSGTDGGLVFVAPLSSISYMKRITPPLERWTGLPSVSISVPPDGVARAMNVNYASDAWGDDEDS